MNKESSLKNPAMQAKVKSGARPMEKMELDQPRSHSQALEMAGQHAR